MLHPVFYFTHGLVRISSLIPCAQYGMFVIEVKQPNGTWSVDHYSNCALSDLCGRSY